MSQDQTATASSSSPPQNVASAAPRPVLQSKGGGHQYTLSTSPRFNPALSDPDYWPDRDGEDDVFSNPDTAEMEARSDATGATSPDRAMSPIVGSPDLISSGTLATRAREAERDDSKRQQQRDAAAPSLEAPAVLHHQASHGSQVTQATTMAPRHDRSDATPTPSTLNAHASRVPSQMSAGLSLPPDHALHLPPANELPQDPSEASHVSSLFVHPPAPPSAMASHGSPAGSSVRLALSGGAPSAFGSPIGSTSASAAGSPLSERNGFQWTSAIPPSSPAVRSVSKTIAARPHSPDRQRTIMPSIANASDVRHPNRGHRASSSIGPPIPSPISPSLMSRYEPGLGLGLSSAGPASLAAGGAHAPQSPSDLGPTSSSGSRVVSAHSLAPSDAAASTAATEASIFERDIEHRDARHVLSKSEAVDVAIPPVLDDAVEAIIESSDVSLEIVEPISSASPAPAALSAMALTAHSIASSPHVGSPMTGSSPPMSHTGAVLPSPGEAPPPGSIAAQIAERLSPIRATVEDSHSVSAAATPGEPRSRHRTTHSSSASSVSSSMRSRSPGNTATIGVQQVLDSSGILTGGSASAASPSRASHIRDASVGAGPSIGRGLPSSGVPGTPSRPLSQHLGTALPSLPLPNPFRSDSPSVLRHSPSASMSSSSEVQGPAGPISMSLDGAVIPSSESAIRELSLDGMADALADNGDVPETSASSHFDVPSPILPRKSSNPVSVATSHTGTGAQSPTVGAAPSLTAPSVLGMFGRRDTDATITPRNDSDEPLKGANLLVDVTETMPGGMPAEDSSSVASAIPSHLSATSTASPRRLSFFSYADIINETPAEVIDLESAIQKKASEDATATLKAAGGSATHRPIISSTSDVFSPSAGAPRLSNAARSAGGAVLCGSQQTNFDSQGKRLAVGGDAASGVAMGRSASAGPAHK